MPTLNKLVEELPTIDIFEHLHTHAEKISSMSKALTILYNNAAPAIKERVATLTSKEPIDDVPKQMVCLAFDEAMQSQGQEEPSFDLDLSSYEGLVDDGDLEKPLEQHAVMHSLLELNMWDNIAAATDMEVIVAACETYAKWHRISMSEVCGWKVSCVAECKNILDRFKEWAAKVFNACALFLSTGWSEQVMYHMFLSHTVGVCVYVSHCVRVCA